MRGLGRCAPALSQFQRIVLEFPRSPYTGSPLAENTYSAKLRLSEEPAPPQWWSGRLLCFFQLVVPE